MPTRPLQLRAGLLCLVSVLAFGPLHAQTSQSLIVKRDTDLRQNPDADSTAVTRLSAHTAATGTGERQGGWTRIRLGNGTTGWVRLFEVSLTSSAPATAAASPSAPAGAATPNFLRGLGSMFAPAPKPVATSTLGIRGLDANDLASAQPNPAAVVQGERLRSSAHDAQQFAQRAGLQARAVDDLPDGRTAAAPSQNAPSQ